MNQSQNSHGIIEDGPPLPPGIKEDGSGVIGVPGASPGTPGSTLFPGLFPPPAASDILAGLPGSSSPDRDRYFSRLLGEQSEKLKELERQKQMLGGGGGSPHKNNGLNGASPSSSSASAPHTCSLCGEGFPEVVALQVHIIKGHGAFPPEIPGLPPPPPGGSTPSTSGAEDLERRESDAKKMSSDESDKEQAPPGEQMARTSSGPPTSAAPSPVTMTVPPAFPFPGLDGMPQPPPPTSEASKQFPHIEMLQRHMLSQQFPNIMAPFLGGLPGFPNPGAAAGSFPNPLQHFLSGVGGLGMGNPAAAASEKKTEETSEGESPQLPQAPKKVKSKKNKRVKLFKCSKCGKKYPRREICLKHIQKAHKAQKAQPKLLSPLKSRRSRALAAAVTSNNHRSHYVRQLMELLRVPTSRGTPQMDKIAGSRSDHRHIMQPFLLKTPGSPMAHRHPSSEDQGGEEDSGNDGNCEAESGSSTGGGDININFVPSLVYLPVAKRISEPLTVAFNLTPA